MNDPILEKQLNVFSIFHDGTITNISRIRNDVIFTVEIQYLAQITNPKFTQFKCKLDNCTKFQYHVWDIEDTIIDNLDTLTKLDLEIYDAKVENDFIRITCFSNDEYYGGNLDIISDDILVYDENNEDITLPKLTEICKLYWNSLH